MEFLGLSEFSGLEVTLSGLGMWPVNWEHRGLKASRNHRNVQETTPEKPGGLVRGFFSGNGTWLILRVRPRNWLGDKRVERENSSPSRQHHSPEDVGTARDNISLQSPPKILRITELTTFCNCYPCPQMPGVERRAVIWHLGVSWVQLFTPFQTSSATFGNASTPWASSIFHLQYDMMIGSLFHREKYKLDENTVAWQKLGAQ